MIILSERDCPKVKSVCAVFGHFDGFHLGHGMAVERMLKTDIEATLFVNIDSGRNAAFYTEKEKLFLLSDSGIDYFVTIPEEAYKSFDSFVRDFLFQRMHTAEIVVDEDYPKMIQLSGICKELGIALITVPTVSFEGKRVCPDILNQLIAKNDFHTFSAYLWKPFIIQGTVVHGKGLGRKFGMPTANILPNANKILPPHGVYGSEIQIGNDTFRCMTNIGFRPSVDDEPKVTVETNIMNFDRDIYDMDVTLRILIYVRGIQKFNGLNEVRNQIDRDIEQIRDFWEQRS